MGFLTGAKLTTTIREVISTGPVDMAVASWGGEAAELLALPADLSDYRIACDAFSGACNPKAMAVLMARKAQIRDVPGLHAKVYLSLSAMVVTSANASTNGLSEDETDPGLEAGMLVTATKERERASDWFEGVFGAGRPLGDPDLPELRRLWKRRRAGRPMRLALAQAILANDPSLADRTLKAYIYDADEPPRSVQKRFKNSPYFDAATWDDSDYPFFWGDIPETEPGAELLCFEVAGSTVSYDDIWRVLAVMDDREPAIWPAERIDDPLGSPVGDMKAVIKRIRHALDAGRLTSGAAPISLSGFASALLDSVPDDHLARIQAEPARAAYLFLSQALQRQGLVASHKTGRVPAVRLEDQRSRYILSYIPNQAHLLFYLRHPALKARPGLAREAEAAGLPVVFNPAQEATIRLNTKAEAQLLVDWLQSVLPLP